MNQAANSTNTRQRILFITYNFPPKLGGMEQVVLRTWTELSARADVTTLAQFADAADDSPDALRPAAGGLLNFFRFLYTKGPRLAREHRADTVVSMSALTAMPAAHIARRARAKAVAVTYGLDTIYPSLVYQGMYRFGMPRMNRVIAISGATRDEAVKRGVAPNKVVLAPPGCDADDFAQPPDLADLRARWDLHDAPVVMIPGRLVRRKGVDQFVRHCLPAILEQVPHAKLLLAGGNPQGALAHTEDMEAAVHRAIAETGVQDGVILTGRLSQHDMIGAFHVADVVVLPVVPVPGDMEGFGIVLIEAGAAGKPVVASRIGGVIDAVADGHTGILVPPEDYAAMAEAIVDFLRDAEKRARFGRAGRERTFNEFTWEICARRFADAILEA